MVVAAVTGVAVTAGAGFEGLGKVRELKDWEEELLLVDFFFFFLFFFCCWVSFTDPLCTFLDGSAGFGTAAPVSFAPSFKQSNPESPGTFAFFHPGGPNFAATAMPNESICIYRFAAALA
jgi:hypothetical protein